MLDGRGMIPRMTGAGRYVIELAQRLPSLARDLAVEVLLLPAMRGTPIPALLRDAGVKVRYVNVRIASLRQWLVIPFVLQRLSPDLYHYPFLDLPYVGFPSVTTIYDLNPILHLQYFHRLARLKRVAARRLIKSTLRRSRVVIAISEATRRLIEEHYPESAHKVRTIHLGVDPAAWGVNPAGDLRNSWSAGDRQPPWRSRPYVLYVGVDRPHKNLVRLVRAFGRFRGMNGWREGAGPYLWLAGVGLGSVQLQAQISKMTLNTDVRLDPPLKEAELRAAYIGAGAVAYVSTSEGFGLPVLEALAASVPVVAAEASSMPEVGGDSVLYTNPHDEVAISEALARIWGDSDLRRTLVERGRRRVTEFSWDATATATVKAYYDVFEGQSTRGRGEAGGQPEDLQPRLKSS